MEQIGQDLLEKRMNSSSDSQCTQTNSGYSYLYSHLIDLSNEILFNSELTKTQFKEKQEKISFIIGCIENELREIGKLPTNEVGPNKIYVEAYKILSFALFEINKRDNSSFRKLYIETNKENEELLQRLQAQSRVHTKEISLYREKLSKLYIENKRICDNETSMKEYVEKIKADLEKPKVPKEDFDKEKEENMRLTNELEKYSHMKEENEKLINKCNKLSIENTQLKKENGKFSQEIKRLIALSNDQENIINEIKKHSESLEAKINDTKAYDSILEAQKITEEELEKVTEQRNKLYELYSKANEISKASKLIENFSTKDGKLELAYLRRNIRGISLAGLPKSVKTSAEVDIYTAFSTLAKEYKQCETQREIVAILAERMLANQEKVAFSNEFDSDVELLTDISNTIKKEYNKISLSSRDIDDMKLIDFVQSLIKNSGKTVQTIANILLDACKKLSNEAINIRKEKDFEIRKLTNDNECTKNLLAEEQESNKELRSIIEAYGSTDCQFEDKFTILSENNEKVEDQCITKNKYEKKCKQVKKLKKMITKMLADIKNLVDLQSEIEDAKYKIKEQKELISDLQNTKKNEAKDGNEDEIESIKKYYEERISKINEEYNKTINKFKHDKKKKIESIKNELNIAQQQRALESSKCSAIVAEYKRKIEELVSSDFLLRTKIEKLTCDLNQTKKELFEVKLTNKRYLLNQRSTITNKI